MFRKLIKLDWILIFSVMLLLGIGLVSLYSMSLSDKGTSSASNFEKQLAFSAIGIAVMLFLAFSSYRYLQSYSTFIFFATIFVLLVVVIWGKTIRGTAGWIGLGSFHFQPVEIAKMALIIFLASFISQKKLEISETGRVIASFVMSAIMIVLVLLQPDFGSAMVLAAIWLGMMVISGISKKFLTLLVLTFIILASIGWIFMADYQKERVATFISPNRDPQGSGYSVIQSKIAIGSGGLLGKGFGHGSQSQLNFLPEKHNDFIFSVISEELGLTGSLIVLFLFSVLFYRIRKIALNAQDNFGYLLASGILIMYFIQFFVNVGMNVGVVPVTGISLPLVSYGGSFLLTCFAGLGFLLNIHLEREDIANFKENYYND